MTVKVGDKVLIVPKDRYANGAHYAKLAMAKAQIPLTVRGITTNLNRKLTVMTASGRIWRLAEGEYETVASARKLKASKLKLRRSSDEYAEIARLWSGRS